MSRWLVFTGMVGWLLLGMAYTGITKGAEAKNPTAKKDLRVNKVNPICLHPVGVVKRQQERTVLEIKPEFAPALQGIEGFSHLWVFYWFHQHDRPEERATLKVHPRRDPANTPTGGGPPGGGERGRAGGKGGSPAPGEGNGKPGFSPFVGGVRNPPLPF